MAVAGSRRRVLRSDEGTRDMPIVLDSSDSDSDSDRRYVPESCKTRVSRGGSSRNASEQREQESPGSPNSAAPQRHSIRYAMRSQQKRASMGARYNELMMHAQESDKILSAMKVSGHKPAQTKFQKIAGNKERAGAAATTDQFIIIDDGEGSALKPSADTATAGSNEPHSGSLENEEADVVAELRAKNPEVKTSLDEPNRRKVNLVGTKLKKAPFTKTAPKHAEPKKPVAKNHLFNTPDSVSRLDKLKHRVRNPVVVKKNTAVESPQNKPLTLDNEANGGDNDEKKPLYLQHNIHFDSFGPETKFNTCCIPCIENSSQKYCDKLRVCSVCKKSNRTCQYSKIAKIIQIHNKSSNIAPVSSILKTIKPAKKLKVDDQSKATVIDTSTPLFLPEDETPEQKKESIKSLLSKPSKLVSAKSQIGMAVAAKDKKKPDSKKTNTQTTSVVPKKADSAVSTMKQKVNKNASQKLVKKITKAVDKKNNKTNDKITTQEKIPKISIVSDDDDIVYASDEADDEHETLDANLDYVTTNVKNVTTPKKKKDSSSSSKKRKRGKTSDGTVNDIYSDESDSEYVSKSKSKKLDNTFRALKELAYFGGDPYAVEPRSKRRAATKQNYKFSEYHAEDENEALMLSEDANDVALLHIQDNGQTLEYSKPLIGQSSVRIEEDDDYSN